MAPVSPAFSRLFSGSLRGESQSVRVNHQYLTVPYQSKNTLFYVPQDGFAMDYLSFKKLAKVFDFEDRMNDLCQIEEIRNFRNVSLGKLSSGMKKFLEILTALYSKSHFAVLDEPFSFLSPVLVEKIIPHIRSQSSTKGIILTDHQFKNVLKTCDKYYILVDCAIKEIKSKSDLVRYGYVSPSQIGDD